jgi:hypothetical protein
MNQATDSYPGYSGSILPSQYNDLLRRSSAGFEGERRLLWAVLQDAIDTYLANMACSTEKQRKAFEEIQSWFHPSGGQSDSLFSFETICDLLEIDIRLLVNGLESRRERRGCADARPPHMPPAAIRLARLAA